MWSQGLENLGEYLLILFQIALASWLQLDYYIQSSCILFEVSVKYIFHFPFWIADTIVVSQYAAK